VARLCQESPGSSDSWTGWESFGADVQPGLAVGQSADGRLEVIAVERATGEVLHRWENFVDGSDIWSAWTGMGAKGQPPVAVGQNEDGNLEMFAPDPLTPGKINHRRQISRASDWLDWSSLDHATLEYDSRTWQTDEGLPNNNVQALAQTPDGYLWVGTSAGLARFDGLAFTSFDTNNTPELRNSSVTALCADTQGALWIGTDGGGLMRLEDGRFTHYTTADGLAGDKLRVIYRSHDGSLWFGTATGMSRYRDGVFTNFTTRQGLSSDVVRAIYEDRDEALWIATGAGLNRLRGHSMQSFAMPNGLPNDSVRVICQDRGGRIWIGSNNGMLWYSSVWTNFYAYNARYGLSDTFVSAICEDREGNLWVGTYSGLNRFHQGRFFTELNHEGAPFDRVNTLFEDRESNLWVGSREGLVRLTPKTFSIYAKRQGLSHNNVMSVMEARNGDLWVGTWGGGLDRLNNERVTAYALTNLFAQGLVLALCQARDGSIWFGADFDGGLTQVNHGEFKHYTSREGLPNAPVRVLHEDRDGVLWIGTDKGLCRFKDGKFTDCTDQSAACRQPIHALYENARGDLWVGTDAGLVCRHYGTVNFTEVAGVNGRQVLCLHEDSSGDLWIGTSEGGLYRLRNGHLNNWTSKDGLYADEIFEILEDDSGWLWMSCSRGVFRVRKNDLNASADGKHGRLGCIVYGKNDGLESIQCNSGAKPAGCKTRDGRLWFPTSKGLACVNPAAARVNALPPPVSIEEMLVDRRPVGEAKSRKTAQPLGSIAPLDSGSGLLKIPPGHGELEFHYTALSLVEPDACRFRYKLDGADSEWVEAGPRRTAHYNNIYPGNHVFRVVACNEDGVWNERGATLEFVLQPHLWQTWWCRGGAAVLVIVFVGGTVRYMTRKRLQRKLEILEQRNALEKERGRIAKDIHDDLGSSLTRIMMLGERAEEGLAKHEEVGVHVGKIVTSARHTVQALDEIVWAVNPENDTLEGLVEYLSHYANEFFENSNVSCRLEIPVRLPHCSLPAEFRHALFLVVKEAFNNILKHAGATQVCVEVGVTGPALHVIIEDNGCGFNPKGLPAGRKGNGLGNMRKRIETLGGQITFSNQTGTRIELTAPLPNQ
jgi:ligand-binding sensor domain-containing protein/signal transduction histidine kinase